MNRMQKNTLSLVLLLNQEATVVYTDSQGVTSIRNVRPLSIERGKEAGRIFVRVHDLNRDAPRSLCLARIGQVAAGRVKAVAFLTNTEA